MAELKVAFIALGDTSGDKWAGTNPTDPAVSPPSDKCEWFRPNDGKGAALGPRSPW
jgi:hypothetical protein